MSDENEANWSKCYSWAQCREPYKTDLDTLGSHWIGGVVTNEQLAFEAVHMLSNVDWVSQPNGLHRRLPLDDVVGQIKILTEAMLTASLRPTTTPDQRRQILDRTRNELGPRNELTR